MAKNSPTGLQNPNKSETALREEWVMAYWKEKDIFQKTLDKEAPQGEFVFYDGPPFATGLPHYGSLLSSIIKDVIPRYKTMRGFRVERRWGWDCHGLPIETLVEKKLGIKTKKDIEKLGVDAFNEEARASVFAFEHEWEKYVERIGRFVDFTHSYKTMDNSYIESVWWALKELHEKELLYEGRKVLMYCPHCETPLAKAEIAMDNTYRDITEEAVTVKFELSEYPGEYFLAWTTTPWTLPANVALAVGPDIEYAKVKTSRGVFIVAENRLPAIFGGERVELLGSLKGCDLIGVPYQPLFAIPALQSPKAHKVYGADFVATNEGTGIVHTAVMYGEDDFALGQREGLPMVQMLDSGAHYTDAAPAFLRGRYIKSAEGDIKEDLAKHGLLFAKEMHTHSYPHCYRCGTPLIYNAVASWFINIERVKALMLEENERINWVPAHLKEGRFKNIVEGAPDWTISRNRYWASPLPIWKEKNGSRYLFIGSLDELKHRVKKSGNRYFLMRHGEAEHMVSGIYSVDAGNKFPLTEVGRKQAAEAAKNIPHDKPIVIISSPVLRARQTAEVVARELGLEPSSVLIDERLGEINFGEFDGKPKSEYSRFVANPSWYTVRPKDGESLEDVKNRFGQALYEFEARHKNSTVVIVTHRIAFEALHIVCEGASGGRVEELSNAVNAGPAALEELSFAPLPVNERFELDLHRPYIDQLVLLDENGREYERIPEVVDCWVESASMPFAALHYPFEGKEAFQKHYPADFIAEYVAQTRTWFYYLHAMGVALWRGRAFNNVISTGTVLAADGAKMSKSEGNYTNPLTLIDRFGADALRLYLMGSAVMQGEDLRFRDEEVRGVHARVVGIWWNSYKFFELYRDKLSHTESLRPEESANVLDSWILSRLGVLIEEETDALEDFDTPRSARAVRAFVEDYSTWYLRRSRERVKGAASKDLRYALATQKKVLVEFSKLIAPLMPFLAESVYRGAGGEKESVHLESWPEPLPVNKQLLERMEHARAIVSLALESRDKAGIKVRQPLALLEVREEVPGEQLENIIAEEVNVKRVIHNPALAEEVWLDTELTPVLREEGLLRDVVRAIQDARKRSGLSVEDRPSLTMLTDEEGSKMLQKHKADLMAHASLHDLEVRLDGSAEHTLGLPFPLTLHLNR